MEKDEKTPGDSSGRCRFLQGNFLASDQERRDHEYIRRAFCLERKERKCKCKGNEECQRMGHTNSLLFHGFGFHLLRTASPTAAWLLILRDHKAVSDQTGIIRMKVSQEVIRINCADLDPKRHAQTDSPHAQIISRYINNRPRQKNDKQVVMGTSTPFQSSCRTCRRRPCGPWASRCAPP